MKPVSVREARLPDAYKIKNLINSHASRGRMLPVSLNQVYERLRDFWVVADERGVIEGCGSLKVIWKDLGEIRSLAVRESAREKGYGKLLMDTLLDEAKRIGMKRVFVLTYIPAFFERFSFERIQKTKLPHKIWIDCINCPKFPRCDEIPLMKVLR
jgi:amino-acid N-acetyltransferase